MALARKWKSNVLLWPVKGTHMQRVNEFVFYELAIKVHRLTEIPNAVKYSQIWSEWSDARDALKKIIQQRLLSFSTQTATNSSREITEIVPEEENDMLRNIH